MDHPIFYVSSYIMLWLFKLFSFSLNFIYKLLRCSWETLLNYHSSIWEALRRVKPWIFVHVIYYFFAAINFLLLFYIFNWFLYSEFLCFNLYFQLELLRMLVICWHFLSRFELFSCSNLCGSFVLEKYKHN